LVRLISQTMYKFLPIDYVSLSNLSLQSILDTNHFWLNVEYSW